MLCPHHFPGVGETLTLSSEDTPHEVSQQVVVMAVVAAPVHHIETKMVEVEPTFVTNR